MVAALTSAPVPVERRKTSLSFFLKAEMYAEKSPRTAGASHAGVASVPSVRPSQSTTVVSFPATETPLFEAGFVVAFEATVPVLPQLTDNTAKETAENALCFATASFFAPFFFSCFAQEKTVVPSRVISNL